MRLKIILAVFLAFLMLLFTACSSDEPEDTDNVQDDAKIEVSVLAEYTIITSEDITDEQKEALNSLLKLINTNFGVLLKTKVDVEFDETAKEILVGNANREALQNVKKTLKYDDYYLGIVGEKLIITGGGPYSVVTALEKLEEILASNVNGEVFFDNAGDALEYKHSYTHDDMKINGVSVSEYTIMYANECKNREIIFANAIKRAILNLCGYELELQPDTEEAYGNVIYIGDVAEGAMLKSDGGIIYVTGATDNDYFFSAQTLIERLENSVDGNVTVSDVETLPYGKSDLGLSRWGVTNEKINVMAYNLQNAGNGQGGAEKYRKLALMIDSKSPDIVALQECMTSGAASENLLAAMKNGTGYGVIKETGVNEAIIYNVNKYTLAEKGVRQIAERNDEYGSQYPRYMLWGRFRSIESGAEFIVLSVHIEYNEPAHQVQLEIILDYMKENYPDLPTILLGDYNMDEKKLDVERLESDGFVNCRNEALVAENRDSATFPSNNSKIDYIFVKWFSCYYYETLTSTENPSDHRPIYGELYLTK